MSVLRLIPNFRGIPNHVGIYCMGVLFPGFGTRVICKDAPGSGGELQFVTPTHIVYTTPVVIQRVPVGDTDDTETLHTPIPGSSSMVQLAYWLDALLQEWIYWVNKGDLSGNDTGDAWICRMHPDGTNKEEVVDTNLSFDQTYSCIDIRQSDGKILFGVFSGQPALFSCDIDGSNITLELSNAFAMAVRWHINQTTYPDHFYIIQSPSFQDLQLWDGGTLIDSNTTNTYGVIAPLFDGIVTEEVFSAAISNRFASFADDDVDTPVNSSTSFGTTLTTTVQNFMDIDYSTGRLWFVVSGSPRTLKHVADDLSGTPTTVADGAATVLYQGLLMPKQAVV